MDSNPERDFVNNRPSPESSFCIAAGSRFTRMLPASVSEVVSPTSFALSSCIWFPAGICSACSLTHDDTHKAAEAASMPKNLFILMNVLDQCLASHGCRLLDAHELEDSRSYVSELTVLNLLNLVTCVHYDERNIVE